MVPTARPYIIRETMCTAIRAVGRTAPPKNPKVKRYGRLRRIAVGQLTSFQAVLEGRVSIARRGEGEGCESDEEGEGDEEGSGHCC